MNCSSIKSKFIYFFPSFTVFSIFVLHYDLEMFCIGGRQGPIDGTDYHLLLKLINPTEDLIVSTTCIFMNNARYKCLFSEEQIGTQAQEAADIGDKVSAGILYAADGLRYS